MKGPLSWFLSYDVDTQRFFDVQTELLPIKVVQRQSVLLSIVWLLVGAVFVGTPTVIWAISDQIVGEDRFYLALPFPIGLWLSLRALRNLRRSRDFTIDGNQVAAEERWLLGSWSWTEPLYEYQGLAVTKTWISQQRLHQRSTQVDCWAVDLKHRDSAKSLRLALLPDEGQAQERVKELSARLRVQPLEVD